MHMCMHLSIFYVKRLADVLTIVEKDKSHLEGCDPLSVLNNPSQNPLCSYDHQLKIVTSSDTFMQKVAFSNSVCVGQSKLNIFVMLCTAHWIHS